MNNNVEVNESINSFGKIRSILWPIHRSELKKFLLLSFLMFANIFVYTVVSNLKDVFVLSCATLGGAELLSPLKSVLVLPSTILIATIFSFIAVKFGMRKTFYYSISFFALFLFLFAFVLLPNASNLHLSAETMINLQNSVPGFMYYIIPIIGNWSFSLFYILAETWGVVSINSLFWNVANRVTSKDEAVRFYAMFHAIGCFGRLLAGKFTKVISKTGNTFIYNAQIIIGFACLFCIISMIIYYFTNKTKSDVENNSLEDKNLQDKRNTKKVKVRFFEGIKILFSSKYLFLIFIIPLSYGVGMHLFEVIFKGYIRSLSSNPNEVAHTIGQLSQLTGFLTFVLTFTGTYILRNYKWKHAALITPITLCISGGLFFILVFLQKIEVLNSFSHLGTLWIGMLIDAVIKGMKYCMLDPTKSMTYRVLNEDTQARAQGAIEIVGGRGGKGLGAAVVMLFTSIFYPGSKIIEHTFGLFLSFIVVVLLWIISCNKLGDLYEEKNKNKTKEGG